MKHAILKTMTATVLMLGAASHTLAATINENSAELRDFKRAIEAQYRLKERAFAARDAETIVTKFYTADAITTGEGEDVAVGREQFRTMYKQLVQDYDVKVKSFYTYVDGKTGWDWADFYVTPRKPDEKPFTFKIAFMWVKVKGQWLCNADMFFKGSFDKARAAANPAATPAANP